MESASLEPRPQANDVDPPTTKWRFSLKALFGITLLVSFFVAPIPWLGEMYVASLIVSVLMLSLILLGVWKKHTAIPVFACALPMLTVFFMFVSPVALLQAAGTAALLLLTFHWKDHVGLRAAGCVGVMIFFYSVMLLEARSRDQRIEALRVEYAPVSLKSRLAPIAPPQTPSQEVEQESETTSQSHRSWSSRQRDLHRLHHQAKRHFVSSAGFGITRMAPFREEHLAVPKSLEAAPEFVTTAGQPTPVALRVLQSSLSNRFLDPEMFGDMDDDGRVAGFAPHALREQKYPRPGPAESTAWRLDRLELVGVLRHEEPVVYQIDGLPSMDQAADAPTRPLNSFESAAFAKLLRGGDLEYEESTKHISMLGAIRAEQHCLQCHHANQGDLLGAFSYDVFQVEPHIANKSL